MSILYLEGKIYKYNTKLKVTHANTQCDVVRQKEMIRIYCLQSVEIDQTDRGEQDFCSAKSLFGQRWRSGLVAEQFSSFGVHISEGVQQNSLIRYNIQVMFIIFLFDTEGY